MINKSDCRIKRSNASFITEKHFLFIVGRVYIALHILRSWTDSLRLTCLSVCVCVGGGGGGCMLGWRRGVTVLSSTSRLFHQEKLEIASDCLLANMPYAPCQLWRSQAVYHLPIRSSGEKWKPTWGDCACSSLPYIQTWTHQRRRPETWNKTAELTKQPTGIVLNVGGEVWQCWK